MRFIISGFSDEISPDIDIQFKVLNELGIDYFEARGINNKNISELNDDEVNALKEKMKAYRIKISSVGSPIGKIKLNEDFTTHFESFKRVVKTAIMLGAKYVRIFSFYHDGDEWTADERTEIISRLKKMISYAKENNIILLHENEKDIYGDVVERCVDLMKELYCDNFKAVFDPANFVQCKQDTKKAYYELKDYIEYMHIKDARYSDDSVVPAGSGDANLEFILKNLVDCKHDIFLSIEPHLGSFAGLSALENSDIAQKLPEGNAETFTLAYNSLCAIINKLK